jgi:tyrosinase
LWGLTAKPVSISDIQFIEDWIDDCCPKTDEAAMVESKVTSSQLIALAYGDIAHPPTTRALNDHKGLPGKLKVRKNIESLSPDELARLRAAVHNMQCFDKYPYDERSFAYWARMHADMCQHGWEQFLTWHRAYLYFFEQRLQDVDPSVTLPYWDWAAYANQNNAAAKTSSGPNDNCIIPEQYDCWIDDSGLANLKDKIDSDTWDKLNSDKIKGKLFHSGNRLYVAAGIQYKGTAPEGSAPTQDDLIMGELQRINPLWHRQRWPGMNPKLVPHYPTPDDIQRILQTPDFAHWGGGPASDHYFGASETVHNYMHNFSGGVNPNYITGQNPELYGEPQFGHMVESRVTAFDPIFWGHHSNVDRLYAQWQELHPGVTPQETESPLAPFEMNVADVLSAQDLGYEYLQDAYHFPTNSAVGMVRFRSEPVGISQRVLQHHRRVEIRLHSVQITERGANIRVFLNQPEATTDTPIERNDHYVGNFMSFVGFCYGGPGHCDVPSSTRRPFDHRIRHHKTPGNLRFDATEAVQSCAAV